MNVIEKNSYWSSSLNVGEREILDCWDAGASAEQVAAQLNLPLKRVKFVLALFLPNVEEVMSDGDIRRSTESLLAKIACVHPNRVNAL